MAHLREEFQVVDGVTVLIGIWLILAPFLTRFNDVVSATWNSVGVGAALVIVAVILAANPIRWANLSWINLLLGVWLVISPFILGFSETLPALLTQMIMGLFVIGLAAGSALGARRV